jgi:hypothetical protein
MGDVGLFSIPERSRLFVAVAALALFAARRLVGGGGALLSAANVLTVSF